jgi:hypothetical protein
MNLFEFRDDRAIVDNVPVVFGFRKNALIAACLTEVTALMVRFG